MKKKGLALLLTLVMVFSLFPTASFAAVAGERLRTESEEGSGLNLMQEKALISDNRPETAGAGSFSIRALDGLDADLKKLAGAGSEAAGAYVTTYEPTELVRVMVVTENLPLLDLGYEKAELASTSAVNAAREMEAAQDILVSQIQSVVDALALPEARTAGGSLTVETVYHYTTLLNGVSVTMPYGALAAVRALDGVESAFVVPSYSVPEDMTSGTADPTMVTTKSNFGSALAWDAGYTGAGMKIAIIDTGLDADHPSFAAAPKSPAMDADDIETVLTQLNAYERFSAKSPVALKARNLYHSEKVAFGYNYVDNDLDITHDKDQQGDHGTHVAGITAANVTDGTDVVGVAPDAQLLIMKVFGKNGGAYWDDIVAALEDSMVLGADAVNMSLGSPAGFSASDENEAEFNEYSDRIYAKVEEHDMILAIAAGNSYSAAFGTPLGTDLNLASDPDNGIVSSPGTYGSATMVASLENESVMYNYITVNDTKVPYTDVAAYGFISTLTAYGQTEYSYVLVGGYGTAEDFAAVGESWENYGKIAVVSRGSLAFTEKQTNASNAGFSGLVIYNNGSDGLMNMEDAGVLPNIFVDADGGAVLKAAADENGEGTLVIENGMTVVSNPQAGQMSDFSSWGVGSDLQLLPDVTAPGGNIYSTVNNGKYGVMSGTSMATPHIAGMSALVLEHLHEKYPGNSNSWYRTTAEALIMSTAEPLTEGDGALYTPRRQGAGAANVFSAVSSPAYLTVNGSTPKISLGDDDEKSGAYTFTFEINNLTDAEQCYTLSGTAMTDQVVEIDGVKYMGETSRVLDGSFAFSLTVYGSRYDYNADDVLDMADVQDLLNDVNYERTVSATYDLDGNGVVNTADVQALYRMLGSEQKVAIPAGGSATVDVKLTLSADDMAYMDENYANGIYVDGFVRCYQLDGENDLSLPFMGFYGDWSAAPAIDDTGWDLANESPKRYWNVLWTDAGYYYNLGANPYIDEAPDSAHNVLSPNGDNYQEGILDLYLGMLRNARKMTFTLTDESGNVVHQTTGNYVRKSYYNSSYGLCIPYIYSNYNTAAPYDFSTAEELTHFTYTIAAYLDDGDETADDIVSIPITIDNTLPVIEEDSVKLTTVDGKRTLTFTTSDNYDIAAIVTLTTAGSIIERIPVTTKKANVDGETATIALDLSKYDTAFVVAVCDYGFNEAYYNFSYEGEGTQNVNGDAFYGYRQMSVIPSGSYLIATAAYNGWYSFEDASSMLMHTDAYYTGEIAVQAAEYVDGWVVGVDANNGIFAMKAGSWERNYFSTLGEYPMALDMAYDFTKDIMYILTDEAEAGEGGYLLKLDLLTGTLTEVCRPTGYPNDETVYDWGYTYVSTYGQALTLACDNEGTLYTINHADGDLYTLDPETGNAQKVGATGYKPKYYQSMTVDHETDKLYWSTYQGYTGSSFFYEIDKATGAASDASSEGIQHNAQMTALFKPYTSYGKDIIPDGAALTGLSISKRAITMAAGTLASLSVSSVPYYAPLDEVKWSSSDENVLTVEDGVVTALQAGTATVTAQCGDVSAQCTVTVITVEADLMAYDATNLMWMSFAANAPQNAAYVNGMTTVDSNYNYFISAAYAHGTVYAFDYYGGFYQMDAETRQGTRVGVNTQFNGTSGLMLAMSYNYADGYLYGIGQTVNGWDSCYYLVRINPANGKHVVVGEIDAMSYGIPVNLAVDRNGKFYTLMDVTDYETYENVSKLFTFTTDDVYDGYLAFTEGEVLQNFIPSDSASIGSLVWSEDNDCLFWANYYGQLLRILPETGETLVLGYIGSTAANANIMNTCLVEFVENEPTAPVGAEITGLSMQDSFKLLVGSNVTASVAVEPWNAVANFEYEIADTDVATVSDKGVITGVNVGSTTLTVTETGSGKSLQATITVVPSTGNIYGVVVQDLNYGANYFVSIPDTDPASIEPIYDFSLTNFAPYAGAYYNGYLYAYAHVVEDMQDTEGFDYEYKYYLLKIDLVDYSFQVLGGNRRVHENLMDMAFDYTTGTMYAVAFNAMSASSLVQIDLETAEVVTIDRTITADGDKLDLRTLACDDKGQLYAVTVDGKLYTLDKTTAVATFVGETGIANLDAYQSMTYDYDTGNTYWAQYGSDGSNGLRLLDLESGAATNLGSIYGVGASVAGLYTVPENAPVVPETVDVTGISLSEKQTVVVGKTLALNAVVLPVSVSAVNGAITWTSGDETVATIDENGVVTGVKAGTVVITASCGGYSAECTVTVTENERRFYAYDEDDHAWISFTGDDPTTTTVERADAADESKIMASLYRDGKLYAFTADGRYWSVNPDTFERTLISEDFADLYAGIELTDWWGEVETNYYKLMPLSMAYDETAGQAYVQMMAYELLDYGYDFYDFYSLLLVPIDLEKGKVGSTIETVYMMDYDTWESYEVEVKVIAGDYYQTEEGFTNAVLVDDGIATFVNTFDSGLITCWDLESGEVMEVALIFNYWGNAEHGRGMFKDPYTGKVYVVRDMRDWGGPITLNTLSLSDGDITNLGAIGLNGNIVNSLFLK